MQRSLKIFQQDRSYNVSVAILKGQIEGFKLELEFKKMLNQ